MYNICSVEVYSKLNALYVQARLTTSTKIDFFSLLWSSKYKKRRVRLPAFGEVSIFSLVILVLCFAYAIFWIATRKQSYSWIGQDVLVRFSWCIVFPFQQVLLLAFKLIVYLGSCATNISAEQFNDIGTHATHFRSFCPPLYIAHNLWQQKLKCS